VNDPVFLDLEDVLLVHDEQLARYHGSPGIRDRGLPESAVAMEGKLCDPVIGLADRTADKTTLAGLLAELARDRLRGKATTVPITCLTGGGIDGSPDPLLRHEERPASGP